jgi:hypothetical protein
MDITLLHELPEGEEGIDFLHPAYLNRMNRLLQWETPIVDACQREMERIRSDPELQVAAWDYHRRLFLEEGRENEANAGLKEMGPKHGMFATVVYISGLAPLIKRYVEWDIEEKVLIDTLNDLTIWMQAHRSRYGVWGLSQLGWLIRHLKGQLFRIGRLQFTAIPYTELVRVYRSRLSGDVLTLSAGDIWYRSDGQVEGTNGIKDPGGGWISSYVYDGNFVTGHPIDPSGFALREPVTLPLFDWEPVLQPGDTVLDVHIPEGGSMTHELCRESYYWAAEFWAKHFPEQAWKAFVCHSWLLGPQLRELLPATSNIIKFQNDYNKIPILSDDSQTFERVFGVNLTDLADPADLPRDTTLQRTIADYVLAGKPIHGAAGFRLRGLDK